MDVFEVYLPIRLLEERAAIEAAADIALDFKWSAAPRLKP